MEMDRVEDFLLPNGLRVFIKPTASQLVCVQVGVCAGSIHEGHLLGYGLSHYLEHLLFKGTERRTGLEIDQTIEAAGGQHNAYTSFDRTVYYVTGLAEKLPTYLDVLFDMVFHSTLRADLLEDERGVILKEINMYLDDPWDVLGRQTSWGSLARSPYRYPIIGFENALKAIKREDLWQYYKKAYVPQNMFVAIVGGVDPEATRWQIEAMVGAMPAGERLEEPSTQDMPPGVERKMRLTGPYEQAYGVVDFPTPYLNSPYQVAISALTQAIGGGESSILWKKLYDEKRLVHSIGTSYDRLGERGTLSISYLADPGKEEAVEAAIFEEIQRIQSEGIAESALERVKRQARVGILDRLKTVDGQTHSIVSNYRAFKDPMHSHRFLEALNQLEVKDLQTVAQLFCQKWNVFCGSIGPGGAQMDLSDAPKALPIVEGEKASAPEREVFEKAFLKNDWVAPELKAPASANRAGQKAYPAFEKLEEDGVAIYVQPGEALPKIHFNITFGAGLRAEPADKRGLSQLLGSFLRRSRRSVVERFEALGGAFTEVVGGHSLGFAIEVLKEDFEEAIQLLTQALPWPSEGTDLQALLERERTTQLESIKNQLDNITVNGFWALRKLVFGESPYGDPVLGRAETVSNIQLKDLESFYRQIFVKGNAHITVTGDFEIEALKASLKPLLAKIQPGNMAFDPQFSKDWDAQTKELILSEREQSVLYQAYPIFGDFGLSDERYTLMVMQEMMSSMGGPLFRSVREAGLGYYASTRILGGWDQSAFVFFAGTEPDPKAQAAVWQAFENEITRLTTTLISPEELHRAKMGIIVGLETALQALGSRAQGGASSVLLGHGVNQWQVTPAKVQAVTAQNIQDFAKFYFDPNRGKTRLMVGPSA